MRVEVRVNGKWRRATDNQKAAFVVRSPGQTVRTGHWTVTGRPGHWQIRSRDERYKIRERPPRAAFADLSSKKVWSRGRAAAFFDKLEKKYPEFKLRGKAQVQEYLTTPSARLAPGFDYQAVAIFGEIVFADLGLRKDGFWYMGKSSNSIRFANNNIDEYTKLRDTAMKMFEEAELHLSLR